MNAYEINKVLGAVLGALVFVMGLSVLSDIIFSESPPEEPGYRVAIAEPEEVEPAEPAEEVPFEVLLASADPADGEAGARVCGACHAFDEGGGNGIGPALWNVVGRDIASVEGFTYSAALQAHAEEAPVWDYAELAGFLENPQGWVPGTSMGYAGIKDREDLAAMIAYLVSVSPDAPPLPEPSEVAATEEAEPAPAEEVEVAAVGDAATDAAAEEPAAAEDAASPAASDAAPADAASADGIDPFVQLVASADPAAGDAAAAVCKACHTVEAGAPHRVGPNLHGVFRREIAAAEGFGYSPAMQTFAETHEAWTIAELDTYLEAPMEVVPGTSMAYAGVKDDEERAAIIAWLHAISPDAGPIVAEAAEPMATDAATAGEAPAAAPATDAEEEASPVPAATEPATPAEDEADAAALDPAPGAVEEARELVAEEADVEPVAGHDSPETAPEAAATVMEEAAREIAEGGVDTPVEPEVVDREAPIDALEDDATDPEALVDTGELEREGVADPVQTGAGTAETVGETDPAPAEAALDTASPAVVDDGAAPGIERAVEAGVIAEDEVEPEDVAPDAAETANPEPQIDGSIGGEADSGVGGSPALQADAVEPAEQDVVGDPPVDEARELVEDGTVRTPAEIIEEGVAEDADDAATREPDASSVTINPATAARVEIINPRSAAQ